MKRQLKQTDQLQEEPLKLRGYLEYCLRDARTGRIVQRGKKHNVITAIGRSYALKQIIATPAATNILGWLALGTGAGATASNSSALGGYFSIKALGTTASTTATDSACTFTGAVSWASSDTHLSSSQISEFSLWNSSTTSATATMFNRLTTGTPINFATSNTLAVTITITN
jgi:hypothetical protein